MLCRMCTSNGDFAFDGNLVCSRLIVKCFRFSTTLQRSVWRLPEYIRYCYSDEVPEALIPLPQFSHTLKLVSSVIKFDSGVVFLDRLAE